MLTTTLTVLIGLLLRIIIPILITAVIVYLLGRLDAHWQQEVEKQNEAALARAAAQNRCWEINGCLPETRKNCGAAQAAMPCWQFFRSESGYLKDACLSCKVFRQAPVPTQA